MVTNGVGWCRRGSARGRSRSNDLGAVGGVRLSLRFLLISFRVLFILLGESFPLLPFPLFVSLFWFVVGISSTTLSKEYYDGFCWGDVGWRMYLVLSGIDLCSLDH